MKQTGWHGRQRAKVRGSFVTASGAALALAAACGLGAPQLRQSDGGDASGGSSSSGGASGGGTRNSGGLANSGGKPGSGGANGGKPNGSGGSLSASGGAAPEQDASTDGATSDSGGAGSGGAASGGTTGSGGNAPATGGAASGGTAATGGSPGTGGAAPSPCAGNPCGPGGTCSPQGGSYTCTCSAGYRSSGGTCSNMDECVEATHDCHPSSACSDVEGGFDCVCPIGYAGGTRGIACRPRVAVGAGHACALLANGTVKCWGADNSWGQLGDNTELAHTAPSAVVGLNNVAALDAGLGTTCAILGDRTVKCWGSNAEGQIGDNSRTNRLAPVPVPGLSDVIAIDTGWDHTCAARLGGSVLCWGKNAAGQLGATNVGGSALTPQGIAGASGASGVAVGHEQSCLIAKSNGSAQCWGNGMLGDGSVSSSFTPVPVKDLRNVLELGFGGFHGCARLASSQVYCWGTGVLLGRSQTTTDGNPTFVPSVGGVSLGIGLYSTVVVESEGTAVRWGTDTPQALPGLTNAVAVSHHTQKICAVHRNGSVSCWTIANGTVSTPTIVPGLNVF
jgi:alpha-tubulin suppressor-like RCC1 family protein